MKTLKAGNLIGNYRIISVINQANAEIVYNGYNQSDSTYVTIREFCPRTLSINRTDTDILVDDVDQANFDKLAAVFNKSAELCDKNKVINQNNTFYIIEPQIIDTIQRDEVFSCLEKIDAEYELANLKGKSKNRLLALSDYEDILKTYPDFFYLHSKSVDNLADCYFYNYYNDAAIVNSTSNCVKSYTIKELNKKAFDLYLQSACRGSAYAQHQIGLFYDKGYSCLCNYPLAAYWYGEAYNNGHKDSAKRLGDFYFYGQGVEQSYEKAVSFYETAAESDSEACLMLVKHYEENSDIDENKDKVYHFLNQAYELSNNDPDICIKLAKCYINAHGTEKNSRKANKLIKKAALSRYTSGVSTIINDIYSKKKIGFGNRIRYFLYIALSYWDCLLIFLFLFTVIIWLFSSGMIFGQ